MIEFVQEAFFWRALIGSSVVAIVAGILGSFIVWRRLAYFGDTLAHSGLLGVTLALLFSLPIYLSLGFVGATVGLILLKLESKFQFSNDTLLGILSHSALAIGLVILSLIKNPNINVLGLLYGDILTISWQDVGIISAGAIVVLALMKAIWTPLLRITIHKALAQVEGVKINYIETIFVLTLALSIALAIKIVGVLLVTALLIIPSATARSLSRSPIQMSVLSAIIGMVAVLIGLVFSFCFDIPTGPCIVMSATFLFLCSLFIRRILQ
jgi:zinc transport system permease protein